jgi:hypothetical protein
MKPIKKPIINTFKRVGIDYESMDNTTKNYRAVNRFSGERVETTELIAYLVNWVYTTSDKYENGDNSISSISISDFDRIRYFILEQDDDVYSSCID